MSKKKRPQPAPAAEPTVPAVELSAEEMTAIRREELRRDFRRKARSEITKPKTFWARLSGAYKAVAGSVGKWFLGGGLITIVAWAYTKFDTVRRVAVEHERERALEHRKRREQLELVEAELRFRLEQGLAEWSQSASVILLIAKKLETSAGRQSDSAAETSASALIDPEVSQMMGLAKYLPDCFVGEQFRLDDDFRARSTPSLLVEWRRLIEKSGPGGYGKVLENLTEVIDFFGRMARDRATVANSLTNRNAYVREIIAETTPPFSKLQGLWPDDSWADRLQVHEYRLKSDLK